MVEVVGNPRGLVVDHKGHMVASAQLQAFENVAVMPELNGVMTLQAAFGFLVAAFQSAAGFNVAGDVATARLQFQQVRLTQKIVHTETAPVDQRLLAGHRCQRSGLALLQGDLAHVGGDAQTGENGRLVLHALFPEHFDEGARLVAFGFRLGGVQHRPV